MADHPLLTGGREERLSTGPPGAEIGAPAQSSGGLGGWAAIPDEAEYVSELTFPASMQTYHRMRADSQIEALHLGTSIPIREYRWSIDPNKAPAKLVEQVARDFGLPIRGEEDDAIPRRKSKFDFDAFLSDALLTPLYGRFDFEIVGAIVEASEWHTERLSPRHPRTLAEFKQSRAGELEAIRQNISGAQDNTLGGFVGMPTPIPASKLVSFVWRPEAGSHVGRSMLRSLYREWLIKEKVVRIAAVNLARAGGVPVAYGAQGASDKQLQDLARMARQFKVAEGGGGAMPFGTKLELVGGSVPDSIAFLRYLDECMSRVWALMLVQLGTTQTGNRALGGEFALYAARAQRGMAKWIRAGVNEFLDRYVEWNDPFANYAPLLHSEDSRPEALSVEQFVALVSAEALVVDPELEAWFRAEHSLPEKAETPEDEELGELSPEEMALIRNSRNPPPLPAPAPPAPAPGAPPAPGATPAPAAGPPSDEPRAAFAVDKHPRNKGGQFASVAGGADPSEAAEDPDETPEDPSWNPEGYEPPGDEAESKEEHERLAGEEQERLQSLEREAHEEAAGTIAPDPTRASELAQARTAVAAQQAHLAAEAQGAAPARKINPNLPTATPVRVPNGPRRYWNRGSRKMETAQQIRRYRQRHGHQRGGGKRARASGPTSIEREHRGIRASLTLPDRKLRRHPSAGEIAAAVDFKGLDTAHANALGALTQTVMRKVMPAQVKALGEQIAKTGAGDTRKRLQRSTLAKLQAPELDSAAVIHAHLLTAAHSGAEAAIREAEAQGVRVPATWTDVKLREEALARRTADQAQTVATLQANGLSLAAQRKATSLVSAGGRSPEQIAQEVEDHLRGMKHAWTREQLRGAITMAQNAGRLGTFAEVAKTTPPELEASELLDDATCAECAAIDGKTYDTVEEAEADYAAGGYVGCLGGPNCRGTLVAIYPEVNPEGGAEPLREPEPTTIPPELPGGLPGGAGADEELTSVAEELDAPAVAQPATTQEGVFALAEGAKPRFDTVIARAARASGARARTAPLKSRARAVEKVRTKYDGDWRKLSDVVRGQIIVENEAELPGALRSVHAQARAEGWRMAKVENRYGFAEGSTVNVGPTALGYRDLSMQLVSSEGMPAELQILTRAMFEAKEAVGEGLYAKVRVLMQRRRLSVAERKLVADVEAKSRALYERAAAEGAAAAGEVAPERFASRLSQVIEESPHGAWLSPHEAGDFAESYLANGGRTGGALMRAGELTSDGRPAVDAVSIFNHGGPKGAGVQMLDFLVSRGANRLDCIGDQLRGLYEMHGFRVVQSIPWDDAYAPAGWDYARAGRPTVYIMEHTG